MKYKKRIILNIGGFYISVNFGPSGLDYEKGLLYDQILSHYRNFITLSAQQSIRRIITIVDERNFNVIARKSVRYTSFYIKKSNNIITFYNISLSQFTLLILTILQELLGKSGFILHASGVIILDKAYLFTGASGSGKSTLAHIMSSDYKQISDDSVIIRKEGGGFFAYQTPMIEKNINKFVRDRTRYKIAAIFFLKKTGYLSHKSIANPADACVHLIEQVWVAQNYTRRLFSLLSLLSSQITIYELSFPKKNQVINYVFNISKTLNRNPGEENKDMKKPDRNKQPAGYRQTQFV